MPVLSAALTPTQMDLDSMPGIQGTQLVRGAPNSAISIAIVEDMVLLAETVKYLCQNCWQYNVVSVCHNGQDALSEIVKTRPDIVLLDLCLPGIDGVTVAKKINRELPSTSILIFSGSWHDYQLHRLRDVSFRGFVDKFDEHFDGLRQAIEFVHEGGSYFSPRYVSAFKRLRSSDSAFFKLLSGRELEVMIWAAQALSDDEIAIQLGITAKTAQTHRKKIMRKLGVRTTPKLIRCGSELGFDIGSCRQ